MRPRKHRGKQPQARRKMPHVGPYSHRRGCRWHDRRGRRRECFPRAESSTRSPLHLYTCGLHTKLHSTRKQVGWGGVASRRTDNPVRSSAHEGQSCPSSANRRTGLSVLQVNWPTTSNLPVHLGVVRRGGLDPNYLIVKPCQLPTLSISILFRYPPVAGRRGDCRRRRALGRPDPRDRIDRGTRRRQSLGPAGRTGRPSSSAIGLVDRA